MSYRKRADLVFGVCFLIFAAAFYHYIYCPGPWQTLFYFTAQSALIGSAADWFAVSALFGKPLGCPWHTDLIRRHRRAVIQSVRNMVENRLIRPEAWSRSAFAFSAVEWGLQKLENPQVMQAAADMEKRWIAYYTDETEGPSPLRRLLMRFLSGAVENQNAGGSDLRTFLMDFLKEKENQDKLVRLLMEQIKEAAQRESAHRAVEKVIRSYVAAQAVNPLAAMAVKVGEMTGAVDYGDMADSLLSQAASAADEWENETHPVNRRLREMIPAFVSQMREDRAVQEAWKQMTGGMDHDENLIRILIRTVLHIRALALEGDPEENNFLHRVNQYGLIFLRRLSEDTCTKEAADNFFRDLAGKAAVQAHCLVGESVENVLEAYGGEKLNRFIRSKISRELSWIRINGAVTGAAAGAVLYLIIYGIYLPLLSFLQR